VEAPVTQGVFVSRFTHSLDPKRRLTIPAEWRLQVGAPPALYVMPDIHERCLRVFPAREMAFRIEKIRRLSISDRKARFFSRVLASQSDLIPWDAQGRIRIKDALLDFAGLTDKVELVGAFDNFELWNPAQLESCGGADRLRLTDAAEYVGF
jgi:MraZ protein